MVGRKHLSFALCVVLLGVGQQASAGRNPLADPADDAVVSGGKIVGACGVALVLGLLSKHFFNASEECSNSILRTPEGTELPFKGLANAAQNLEESARDLGLTEEELQTILRSPQVATQETKTWAYKLAGWLSAVGAAGFGMYGAWHGAGRIKNAIWSGDVAPANLDPVDPDDPVDPVDQDDVVEVSDMLAAIDDDAFGDIPAANGVLEISNVLAAIDDDVFDPAPIPAPVPAPIPADVPAPADDDPSDFEDDPEVAIPPAAQQVQQSEGGLLSGAFNTALGILRFIRRGCAGPQLLDDVDGGTDIPEEGLEEDDSDFDD